MKLKVESVKGISNLVKDDVLVGLTKSSKLKDFPAYLCEELINSSKHLQWKIQVKAWWFIPYEEGKKDGKISLYIKELLLDGTYKTHRGTVTVVPSYNLFERIRNWFRNKYGGFKDDLANM